MRLLFLALLLVPVACFGWGSNSPEKMVVVAGGTDDVAEICLKVRNQGSDVDIRYYVYSSGSLVATSDESTITSSSFSDVCADISGPTLVSGSTYIVAFMSDSGAVYAHDTNGYDGRYTNTGITYPTGPTTLPSDDGAMPDTIAIQVKNSSGTVLLGVSSMADYTSTQTFSGDSLGWHRYGYTY